MSRKLSSYAAKRRAGHRPTQRGEGRYPAPMRDSEAERYMLESVIRNHKRARPVKPIVPDAICTGRYCAAKYIAQNLATSRSTGRPLLHVQRERNT